MATFCIIIEPLYPLDYGASQISFCIADLGFHANLVVFFRNNTDDSKARHYFAYVPKWKIQFKLFFYICVNVLFTLISNALANSLVCNCILPLLLLFFFFFFETFFMNLSIFQGDMVGCKHRQP